MRLQELLKAYVELNRIKACQPGEASHMIAHSIAFIQRQILAELKKEQK